MVIMQVHVLQCSETHSEMCELTNLIPQAYRVTCWKPTRNWHFTFIAQPYIHIVITIIIIIIIIIIVTMIFDIVEKLFFYLWITN